MSKGLHCAKCGERTKELYSPDWTCERCTPPEIKSMYPDWLGDEKKQNR